MEPATGLNQLALSILVVMLVEKAKGSASVPWISNETKRLNRVLGAVLAAVTGLGVSYTWSSATGDLAIHGLTVTNLAAHLWDASRAWLVQQGCWEIYSASQKGGET